MKNAVYLLALIFLIYTHAKAQGESINLVGVYQGENLYVLNPFAATGVGFCIYEVKVNDEVSTDEINSSSFEIDFKPFGLNMGDEVKVTILHKDGCTPRVLNEDVLKPKSTYTATSMKIDKDGILQWTTIGENGSLPYEIQQFRWNKWTKVAEIDGIGRPEQQNYSFNLFSDDLTMKPHSGVNKYRVKQSDFRGRPRYSMEVTYRPIQIADVSFSPVSNVKDLITFTDATSYEIFDSYGKLIDKGYGTTINTAALEKGNYYLNYDNKAGQMFSKK